MKKAHCTLIEIQAFAAACVVNLSGWCRLHAQPKRARRHHA
ncbi:unnamed protein product [Mycetohabitans rhizoxinica HKI 454]|uniref:Uncharacterized protein n=1 Tax=Mycetohabitans rhizoxinica (strain DSM 19002 / CIP 109453 / HKI 454) TaxID=882378 RepID=E5APA4_MYCRK|nr:unnamed protein product [Mycetohabitans rhizoxinica HKI 454]